MPDERLGERICAYLVLKEGGNAPTIAQLAQHLQEVGLAKFKWPERIEVVAELPVTRVGKLDKAALRKDIAERLQQETAPIAAQK
jgi:non-ribosomal peptide synthetase component E (peptide arylation enzyme)